MKKLLLIIAALFVSFNTFGQTINGIEYELEGNYAYIIGHEYGFNPTELIIPETITYGNTTYTITVIDPSVFSDCTNLKTLEIQSSITIGRKAFNNGCLVEVTCKSTTPPTIGSYTFGTNSDLKIYVPVGCVNAYKSAETWNDKNYAYAQHIQGEDPIEFVGDDDEDNTDYWNSKSNWKGIDNIDDLVNKDVIIRSAATIPSSNNNNNNFVAKVKSFTIKEGGSITIEEGGQFIVHAKSEGSVTMEKNISKYSAGTDNVLINGWYTISSPFEGSFTLSENNFLKGTYELFRYNETTSMWENKKAHSDFTTLEAGKGYLYANKEGQTLYITGKPNINDQTINLTAQGTISELQGFNLIGNPFTHNIYKGEGASIYDKNLSEGYYTLTNEGKWQTILDSEPIKPMQGILVKTDAECSITIGHTHKSPSSKRSNNGVIAINVANNEYNDVAYISFNKGIGLDKIEHRNNEIPMVYVPVDGTDYAIAIMDENAEEIPVNFEAKKMGEYTIGISTKGRKYNTLTLIDKQDNNKEIDMLKGNYTFLATTTDDPARFILKVSLNNNQEAAFYTENNSIIIENIKGKGSVQVYDVMGRPVIKYNTNDSNCQLSTSSLANGVYIIQLIDENGTQVQKVIVNN